MPTVEHCSVRDEAELAGNADRSRVGGICVSNDTPQSKRVQRMVEHWPRGFRRVDATPGGADKTPSDLDLRPMQVQRS